LVPVAQYLTNELLPGTAALSNLTSLTVQQLHDGVPHLQHLPQQLQELTMTLFRGQPHAVDLSHVTGLTRLQAQAVRVLQHTPSDQAWRVASAKALTHCG
jgi:hypothetical protein